MKKLLLLSVSLGFMFAAVSPAAAVNDPPLFSCTGPIGSVSSQYSSGVHGVPGRDTTFTGSDTVYQIDEDHVLQCLCVDDSSEGIQSNWWKVPGLSASDIQYFQRRGWVYVPEGNKWGLASAPFLVKNETYVCSSGRGGVALSSATGAGGGSVLGMSTLGETGTTLHLIQLLGISLLSGALALRLARE